MHKQRGMVLILAMLIVVLVISITVGLSWRYNLSLTRSENRWHGLQARAYLEGAETFAAMGLQEDAQRDQEIGRLVDSLDEFWTDPVESLTDEGWVRGRLEDAQGRFNINSLQQKSAAMQGENPPPNLPLTQRFTASQKRFIRLLQTFEFEDGPMDLPRAVEITEAIIDWIDVDQNVTGFGGAETPYYQQLDPPTTPPNWPMVSVSELVLIKGMTAELYRALLPYVIALPENVKLNINTMPLALMRTLSGSNNMQPLPEADAQSLMDERSGMSGDASGMGGGTAAPNDENQPAQATGGFESVDALKSSPTLTALLSAAGGLDTDGLVVDSHYFLLFSEARVGDTVSDGKSMLKQENGKVTVIRRTDAHF